jgi:hypothetical protein
MATTSWVIVIFGESSPNSLVLQAVMLLGQLSGIARVSIFPINRLDQKSSPKMTKIQDVVTRAGGRRRLEARA